MENNEGYYQDESTRKSNALGLKMRELFNNNSLAMWEYIEFKRMIREYAKANDLFYNESNEMVYKKRNQTA